MRKKEEIVAYVDEMAGRNDNPTRGLVLVEKEKLEVQIDIRDTLVEIGKQLANIGICLENGN